MEIAALVVAVLSVMAASASALYARGANTRADEANRRAAEALDLQRRIDERAREFVDIKWELLVDRDHKTGRLSAVSLQNVGLTPAVDVTVVIEVDGFVKELCEFEQIEPGAAGNFSSDAAALWMEKHKELLPLRPGFRVHWATPLGNLGDERVGPDGIFEIG